MGKTVVRDVADSLTGSSRDSGNRSQAAEEFLASIGSMTEGNSSLQDTQFIWEVGSNLCLRALSWYSVSDSPSPRAPPTSTMEVATDHSLLKDFSLLMGV